MLGWDVNFLLFDFKALASFTASFPLISPASPYRFSINHFFHTESTGYEPLQLMQFNASGYLLAPWSTPETLKWHDCIFHILRQLQNPLPLIEPRYLDSALQFLDLTYSPSSAHETFLPLLGECWSSKACRLSNLIYGCPRGASLLRQS